MNDETRPTIEELTDEAPTTGRKRPDWKINRDGKIVPRQEPYRRTAGRIGRNEPCPCLSGRKYKKCCLQIAPTPPKTIDEQLAEGADSGANTQTVAYGSQRKLAARAIVQAIASAQASPWPEPAIG